VIVLYDLDCGFCRWTAAWIVRLDPGERLVAAPIQSPLGSELLADLPPADRLAAAHMIDDEGRRHSAGAAAAEVISALDRTHVLARVARISPRTTDRLYGAVARRRMYFGRFVGRKARERADRLLEASGVTTAAELRGRSQRPPA